ncbi:MAG: antibiotic biosynthesis monooxygenase [Lewinella sp.]|nr:antibiotic biosynthesis monooxygenase [Lewinella sp.]
MHRYGLHGKLTAKAGQADQLADILLRAAELVSTAKGCRLYAVSKDPTDEHAVWITEIWDTKADHDQSLQLPGVRELIGQAMPLLDGMPQKGQELEILGGAGVG